MLKRYCYQPHVLLFLAACCCLQPMPAAQAQTTPQALDALRERLIGRPLYLRGLWAGSAIEFAASGQPLQRTPQGPFPLSGLDVHDVSLNKDRHGEVLVVDADRVGLVANAQGRLERRSITNTTRFLLMVQKKYVARQQVRLLVHPDAAGFDAPLRAIFADGLRELAASAPPYWSCYAKGYLAEDVADDYAEKVVNACATRLGSGLLVAEQEIEPEAKADVWTLLPETRELRPSTGSRIHLTIGPLGYPLRFQIVRPAGGGFDESCLQVIAERHFKPVLRESKPVPADVEMTILLHQSDE